MKVLGALIMIALYGYIIYIGIKAAKERRAKRYNKFFNKVAESVETEDDNNVEVKEQI